MSDRRAEAFAALDIIGHKDEMESRMAVALRSVLERHHERTDKKMGCVTCFHVSPCPDETDVIDALLGWTV